MGPTSFTALVVCVLLSTSLFETDAKIFTHCELAQELRRLQIPESQIATWVCIAHYESRLNSSAISQTGDHGIFQISDEYWCSPPGRGKACALSCAELEDDDISDDIECVQTIFDEHHGLSGNGFNAWAVYPRCRKPSATDRFIRKCTSGGGNNSINSLDTQLNLRGGNPNSFQPPPRSSLVKPSSFQDQTFAPRYTPIQNFGIVSYSPFQAFVQPSYTASQDFGKPRYTQDYRNHPSSIPKTSVSPFSRGYDYMISSSPLSYTSRKPLIQVVSSSTVPPPTAFALYSPSRPSGHGFGFVNHYPFETRSTTTAPIQYLTPKTSFNIFGNRETNLGFQSTPAQTVHRVYSRPDAAQVKTSSPAPTYKFKAPWADFPWWNGGK